jgi:hypothetical protein
MSDALRRTKWVVVWRDFESGVVSSFVGVISVPSFDNYRGYYWMTDGGYDVILDENVGTYLVKQQFSYLDTDGYGNARKGS